MADYIVEIPIFIEGEEYLIGVTYFEPPDKGVLSGPADVWREPTGAFAEWDLLDESGKEADAGISRIFEERILGKIVEAYGQ